ncbi:Protein lin-52 [Dirofilaria immitis]
MRRRAEKMDDSPAAEKAKNTNLVCNENIAHRKSPELFPENVPGAWDMNRTLTAAAGDFRSNRFRTELDTQDVRLVNELGQFSADQLMEYVRSLQNSAYTLGIEEAKQFSKGKFLRIFEKRSEGLQR